MSEPIIFNFGEYNGKDIIVAVGSDGRYHDGFYISDEAEGISEAEAIQQWLIGKCAIGITNYRQIEKHIDRLVYLAESK